MADQGFPHNFLWGVASSSFQIEGTEPADGRGLSIWDTFAATPGKIADKGDGRRACNHYQLWEKDLALMGQLGIGAYRFSIAWPRILPHGRGTINQRGLDFYSRLIDGLLARGIQPWVTLYHWDLPQALEDEGGWRVRSTAEAFADYASIVATALGDRVQHWITHNEPWCVAVLGHRTGHHAPGATNPNEALRAAHHVLLSHGLALERLRAIAPKAEHGITLNLTPAYALDAAQTSQDEARIFDGDFNRWYLDPLFRGAYPDDMLRHYEAQGNLGPDGWDFIAPGDLALMHQPLDFLGVNYYTRAVFGQHPPPAINPQDTDRITAMGWEIYPEGLGDLLRRLHQEYPARAYYITENGAAFEDQVHADGCVHDGPRIRYMERHLAEVEAVAAAGVPIQGYFAWSIMDNFEWAFGYQKRFGLLWVDYETQARIFKDSFHWYREVVKANRLPRNVKA